MSRMKIYELYLKTIFCCIACDGEIAPEEVQMVQKLSANTELFTNLDVENHLNSWIKQINENGSSFLRAYLSDVAEMELSEEQQLNIIDLAFKAIEADNRIEYAEVKFFKKIRLRLSIGDDKILDKYPDKEDFLLPDNNVAEDPDWDESTHFSEIHISSLELNNSTIKSTPSKEVLIERLKAIAKEEVPTERELGACCYSIAPPPQQKTKCDCCGKTIKYESWDTDDVKKTVDKMIELGYDAKVETLCKECCEKVKSELYPNIDDEYSIDGEHKIWVYCSDRNFVFYFRTDKNEPYHRAIANGKYYYQPVLSFLQGKSSYKDSHGRDNYLSEELHVIEFMTGLKIDD